MLLNQFLLKLELLRLTENEGEGGNSSRAEYMLMKENEILRSRLSTLKENIAVLNKMIDQVKMSNSSAKNRSV